MQHNTYVAVGILRELLSDASVQMSDVTTLASPFI